MSFSSIAQCDRRLDFKPRGVWPKALPAYAWQGLLLTAFERREGPVVDLWELNNENSFLDALWACYPSLGLAELSRLEEGLRAARPTLNLELRERLFAVYGLRHSDRLQETLEVLLHTPFAFQNWVDEKKLGARDLAALLAIPKLSDFSVFLEALVHMPLSKSQAVLALETVVDLALMGRPLNDLLPSDAGGEAYLQRLLQWRKPQSAARDEEWRQSVTTWPWPSQVQGHWQRFGDQTGLEIKIRTTSPQDLQKKLERLVSIGDTWSCNG